MKPSRATSRRSLEAIAWRSSARAVLLPIVRALLAEGFRYDDLVEVLDEAVVAATADDGTAARSGLPAQKLNRLRSMTGTDPALPLTYSLATRLISRWLLEPAFTENGKPRKLPMHGPRSFDTLAGMVGVDAGSVLRELVRVGAVRVEKGTVRLQTGGYVPARGLIEKLDILGRDGAEFLSTMLHNVKAPAGRALLQRKASYDNIGSAALEKLRAQLSERGMAALLEANRELARNDRDRNPRAPGGRRTRVSFGVWMFEEPVQPRRSTQRSNGGKRRGRS